MRIGIVTCALTVLAAWAGGGLIAADQWIEMKSAHFTVVSNAGERNTRRLVWQLEQVRSATAALFSWARPDLNKPLSVIALKDENSMRALAPQYWEERRSIRPASVWVTGPDQHTRMPKPAREAPDGVSPRPSSWSSQLRVTSTSTHLSVASTWCVASCVPARRCRGRSVLARGH